MREDMIPPFGTTVVKDIANLTMHSKCLGVDIEPGAGYSEHIAVARSYGILRQGTSVGEITAANIIPSCSKLVISVTEHLVEVVDKLSTTAVVFFRSERILKCMHLYGA